MSDNRPQNIKDSFPLRPKEDDDCVCGHKFQEHGGGFGPPDQSCGVCVCNDFKKKE